jgi:hypothetical protein
MSSQSHNHSKHRHTDRKESGSRKFHKDWRVWLALLLMLGGIVLYVLTLDDSIIPR